MKEDVDLFVNSQQGKGSVLVVVSLISCSNITKGEDSYSVGAVKIPMNAVL